MIEHIEHFEYRHKRIIRPDGSVKVRELAVPDAEARAEHAHALDYLYSLDIPMPHATGGVPGRKLIDNVKPHRQGNHFYMVDLADAFPRVKIDALERFVDTPAIPEGYKTYLHYFIGNWATSGLVSGLPLGAPASPFLFNLYCQPVDENLAEYCEFNGITYTRYLDDLTFSSKQQIGYRARRSLRDIIVDSTDMQINPAKSRVHSLSKAPVTITGASLQPDRRIAPNPRLIRRTFNVLEQFNRLPLFADELNAREIGLIHGYHGAAQQLTPAGSRLSVRLREAYDHTLYMNGLTAQEPDYLAHFGRE